MAHNLPNSSSPTTFAPLIDGFVIALAGWLAYFTRWNTWDVPLDYLSVLILGIGLALVLFPVTGTYRSWRGTFHWRDASNAIPGLLAVTTLLIIVGALTKTTADFSRLWMGYWFIYSVAGLITLRWFIASAVYRLGLRPIPSSTVVLVGSGEFANSIIETAEQDASANWHFFAQARPAPEIQSTASNDLRQIEFAELEAMIAGDHEIDEVWIALDNATLKQQKSVIDMLQGSCMTVRYFPDLSMLALLNHVPSDVAGMTVIDLNASPLTGHNSLIKAGIDKLIAAVALLVLSPALLVIAALIKLDSPGPIFFRQQRHGWDGKIIDVLKFRTMTDSASSQDTARQAQRQDPRITRVGRFLRKTSLDETPQFVNVLVGNMSIVGPRPHPLELNENYVKRISAYMQRHRVKPGITGWAQIHGLRGETETLEKMQRRVEYDLYYIEHWSLWLDFKIILRTLLGGWMSANAY